MEPHESLERASGAGLSRLRRVEASQRQAQRNHAWKRARRRLRAYMLQLLGSQWVPLWLVRGTLLAALPLVRRLDLRARRVLLSNLVLHGCLVLKLDLASVALVDNEVLLLFRVVKERLTLHSIYLLLMNFFLFSDVDSR